MEKRAIIYLEHIAECISKIKRYVKNVSHDQFIDDELIQDAVIRNLEIIGEATKQIDNEYRLKHPTIEWKKIAGLRDKLIHDYIGVDMEAVWIVVKKDIPDLETNIKQLIRDYRGD